MAATQRLTGRKIVCVGVADWDTELWTNQHHLMHRLAAENEVLFVESLGLRQPKLAARDLSRIWRRLRRGLKGPRSVDGLHVLSPLVIPAHGHRSVRAVNARLLPLLVKRSASQLDMGKPILWSYVPQAEVLIDALQPELIVYHCVDDIAAHPGIDTASFRAAEERFAARADLVLASAPPLAQRLGRISSRLLYAPNVADTELFATALQQGPVDPALQALPAPRVVFTGAVVRTKLDFELILALAQARPQWSFALVGPVGLGDPGTDVTALAAEPNIHLLGHRPHRKLPEVLRGAELGLIPYALNALTRSIFPMKVYEYLAAGLPVLSTPLPAIADVEHVAAAVSAQQLAQLGDALLAEDSPARRAECSRYAASHSWESRLAEIAQAIAEIEGASGDRG
ncbi:MAG TPA: glycosyltransferase [Solirubrobacteraceae bacterium]